MKRALLLLAPAAALCAQAPAAREPARKPNFLVILADDLGYGDLGCTGSKQIQTPAIDSLARDGAFCTRGYVAAPVCSPSRVGLLTGRAPAAIGVVTNPDYLWPHIRPEFAGLPVASKTIPDRLKAAGYVSSCVGKWHLGHAPQFHPTKRGFDEFYGFLAGGRSFFPHPGAKPDLLECNYRRAEPFAYLTDDLAAEGAAFIKRHRDKPFFLYMAFNAPHAPLQPREDDLAAFAHIPDKSPQHTTRKKYLGLVRGLDRGVGTLLAALKDAGVDDHTCVIFLSDNGGPTPYTQACNAPFAGMKGTNYEGGMRVPFLVRWPGVTRPGTRIDMPVWTPDLMATFTAAAGVPLDAGEKTEGIDIRPALRGESSAKPRPLYARMDNADVVIEGAWKLIQVPDRLPMVFHLAQDPGETTDLFLKEPVRAEILLRKLGRWQTTNPAPSCPEDPYWAFEHLRMYGLDFDRTQPETDGVMHWKQTWKKDLEDCPQ